MSIATVAPVAGTTSIVAPSARVERAVVGGGAQPRAARVRQGLKVVDGAGAAARAPLASVSRISEAPSVRRRVEALRAEDPVAHRRPLPPRRPQAIRTISLADALATVWAQVVSLASRIRLAGVLYAAAFTAAMVVAVMVGLSLQGSGYAGPTVVHSVGAGESVWSLAATVDTDRPLADVVSDIQSLNNISGGLSRGQQVVLPLN